VLFDDILKSVVEQDGAPTPYWPSSPSANFEAPANSQDNGDMHYWGVWHALEPIGNYNLQDPRFMSEFGFQSFQEMRTILSFAAPEELVIDSPVMMAHQKNHGGNERILTYMLREYPEPKDFASFIYLSQVQQAEAIKVGAEHLRRNRPRTMGAIFWQLNDCWPVASLQHGVPGEFDRSYFRHQMPGGMMGTMKRQLAETKRLHLLQQVLEEVERVRAELGYPIMVTPFSQVVGTQALLNVVSGKRYETIPDEVTRYVIGRFGAPAMPLDKNVEDRIRSSKRARELESEPHMASLDELRAKIGKDYSDEEFLLRAVMPADQVDAMKAVGPARRDYDSGKRSVMNLVAELAMRKDLASVKISKPGFRLELNGGR
jgi:hypothetical protein